MSVLSIVIGLVLCWILVPLVMWIILCEWFRFRSRK
jgi:hypothetical protein